MYQLSANNFKIGESKVERNNKMLRNTNVRTNITQNILLCISILALFYLVEMVKSAATHGGREREADGAYSPRDKHHGEGDHHNAKFDHEAILGELQRLRSFPIKIRIPPLL